VWVEGLKIGFEACEDKRFEEPCRVGEMPLGRTAVRLRLKKVIFALKWFAKKLGESADSTKVLKSECPIGRLKSCVGHEIIPAVMLFFASRYRKQMPIATTAWPSSADSSSLLKLNSYTRKKRESLTKFNDGRVGRYK
jgi:hypothetical protein